MLPVFKDTIAKIERVYKPVGYRIGIPVGKKGKQLQDHFYMRIVPKYKLRHGSAEFSGNFTPAKPWEAKEAERVFQPKLGNIVAEKGEIVVKLHNEFHRAALVISTKDHLANDISAMDDKTWAQIGELIQQYIKKMDNELNVSDYIIRWELGEEAFRMWKQESGDEKFDLWNERYRDSEVAIKLFPRFETKGWRRKDDRAFEQGQMIGTMDNERVAEKLRDPDAYYRKWGKNPRVQLEKELAEIKQRKVSPLWLIPSTLFTIGITLIVICMLALRRKRNKN